MNKVLPTRRLYRTGSGVPGRTQIHWWRAASKLGNSAITIPLDGIALQTLKTAVVDEDLDLVTREGWPNLVPVDLQLRLTEGCSYV